MDKRSVTISLPNRLKHWYPGGTDRYDDRSSNVTLPGTMLLEASSNTVTLFVLLGRSAEDGAWRSAHILTMYRGHTQALALTHTIETMAVRPCAQMVRTNKAPSSP